MRRVQAVAPCPDVLRRENNDWERQVPSLGNCKRIDKGAEASLGAVRLCQERWDRNVAEAFRKCFPSEDPLNPKP